MTYNIKSIKLRLTQQIIFRVIWGGGKVIFSEKTLCLVSSYMPYSTINGVTGLKSANQQLSQNRSLCVQKSNYNHCFSFQNNLHRILYIPFEKRKNDRFPLALLKCSWKCYFNARECLMGFSTNTVKIWIMLYILVFKNSSFLTTCQIRRICCSIRF